MTAPTGLYPEKLESGNRKRSFLAKMQNDLPLNIQNNFLPGSLPLSLAVVSQCYKPRKVVIRFQWLLVLLNP